MKKYYKSLGIALTTYRSQRTPTGQRFPELTCAYMLDFICHFSEKDSYVIGRMQLSTCTITIFIPYTYVCSRPEAQLSTCLVTVKRNRDRRYACFQEKYYLGYVLLEQLSIATDIQFHIFNFKICLRAYSAHTMST